MGLPLKMEFVKQEWGSKLYSKLKYWNNENYNYHTC